MAVQGVLYQSILNAKLIGRNKLGRKMCTSNRDDRKLENTVKQSRFKHLGELHKEWTEAGVLASRVTTLRHLQEKGYQADFIFQQDLAPAHTAKGTKSWFNDHGVTVLDWPANSADLNPIENLWSIVKRKMRDTRPNKTDDIKVTWASITSKQCHRLIASMPRRIDAVIHAIGGPTMYWMHRNEHTFQKPDNSV